MSEWKKLSLRARKLGEALSVADPTDLAKFSYDELIAQRNCGESTVREITDYLASRGLQLRTNNPPDCWPRPIPVSERLPEDGQRVIAYISDIGSDGKDDGFWITATYNRRKLFDGGLDAGGIETFWEIDEATHWITMPPKPASSATPQ